MPPVNIFDIKPHQVSSDLTGYVIGLYSRPGAGKTTFASQAEKPIFLATEIGYKALPGVMAQPINSWSDFLIAVSQLRKPEAKERYRTVVIDTLDELVFLATEHVLQSNGVKDLVDIPFGKGYNLLQDALRRPFRQIVENYGLILLAHDTSKQDEDDKEIKYATLTFNKKVKSLVMALLDLLIYVEMKRGEEERIMHFQPSENWDAKTRFRNITPHAVFSYDRFIEVFHDAVGEDATTEEREQISTDGTSMPSEEEFENFLNELNELAITKLQEKESNEEVVVELIAKYLDGRKLSMARLEDYYELIKLEEELKELE